MARRLSCLVAILGLVRILRALSATATPSYGLPLVVSRLVGFLVSIGQVILGKTSEWCIRIFPGAAWLVGNIGLGLFTRSRNPDRGQAIENQVNI